ncbi:MAG: flagellar biosynthesis protein FlaG [Oceanospirillaceae bacterium]|nr:flagellar biosynthesis protein FlaG [Oceanospirillaceae bacterium]MBT10920.1 flagellar biosynthesis protein FlaG [Oceanospirillaceae bacterium]|tara:strand:- start:77046 stop:77423 length:378 start_codon:yes stop_codon:yes gene_type:complete
MSELKLNIVDQPAVSPSVVKGASEKSDHASATGAKSGKVLPPAEGPVTKLSQDEVQEAVSRINEYVQQTERTLDFQLDEDSGRTVIRVYDKSSSELIRQIPSELALELAQKLNDEEPTLLFSAQV